MLTYPTYLALVTCVAAAPQYHPTWLPQFDWTTPAPRPQQYHPLDTHDAPRFLDLSGITFEPGSTLSATLDPGAEGTTECGLTGAEVACTVQGSVQFSQHLFSHGNTDYTVWLHGSGVTPGAEYYVGVADDCVKTNFQQLNDKIVAPFFMVNGFYIKGRATTHNADGSGGRTALTDKRFLVTKTDTDGTVVGCTTANLA